MMDIPSSVELYIRLIQWLALVVAISSAIIAILLRAYDIKVPEWLADNIWGVFFISAGSLFLLLSPIMAGSFLLGVIPTLYFFYRMRYKTLVYEALSALAKEQGTERYFTLLEILDKMKEQTKKTPRELPLRFYLLFLEAEGLVDDKWDANVREDVFRRKGGIKKKDKKKKVSPDAKNVFEA